MSHRNFAVALAALIVLGACDKKPADTAAPAADAAPPAATPATTAATAAPAVPTEPAPTAAVADSIGVAECDDFLARYAACVDDKVPEASRAALQQSLDATRAGWKQAVAAGGKDTLAQACTTMREQSRASMQAYGCEF